MTRTEKNVWLIESTGDNRQVWGPYGEAHARKEQGVRHFLALASGLTNGQTMTRGELQAALQSGRIRSVDRIDVPSLA